MGSKHNKHSMNTDGYTMPLSSNAYFLVFNIHIYTGIHL